MKQIIKLITVILIGSLLAMYLYMIYGLLYTHQWGLAAVAIVGTALLIKAIYFFIT